MQTTCSTTQCVPAAHLTSAQGSDPPSPTVVPPAPPLVEPPLPPLGEPPVPPVPFEPPVLLLEPPVLPLIEPPVPLLVEPPLPFGSFPAEPPHPVCVVSSGLPTLPSVAPLP